jgi:hypothetical protein
MRRIGSECHYPLVLGRKVFIPLVGMCAALVVPAGAGAAVDCNAADNGLCARAAADGSRVFFTTHDELVSSDDFESLDVYELEGKKLTLLTPKPAGEAGFPRASWLMGISRDGSRAIIETQHRYSPLDTDDTQDFYVLEGGRWTMVSPAGQLDPILPLEAFTSDARHILFSSQFVDLVPSDTDHDGDLYEWNDGVTRIVSTGPTERTTPPPPNFTYYGPGHVATNDDASRIYFETYDHLTADDTNEDQDLYERDNAATTRLIPVPGDSSPYSPMSEVGGTSADGSHLFINTDQRIDPADTDTGLDVYDRTGAGFTLISRGSQGGNGGGPECRPALFPCSAEFSGASRDGSRVFFMTDERLTPDDTDLNSDLYERFAGSTRLVSIGPSGGNTDGASQVYAPRFAGASDDGTAVAFSTVERLVAADKDRFSDIYVRRGDAIELASTGPDDRNQKYIPRFAGFTDSGNAVMFWTNAPLVPTDRDHTIDIYERIQVAGASAASKRHRKRSRAKGKTKLVSAEHIPPKIRIAAHGRRSGGIGSVRVSCPKSEKSAPCVGNASAGGPKGKFRIRRGRSAWVPVGNVGGSARVVARARDQLGNRAKAKRTVTF